MNEINRDNFAPLLDAFLVQNQLVPRRVAESLGCSDATLTRLLMGATLPTDHALRQGAILMELGFARYSTLTTAERETVSETLGAVSGGGLGFASVTGAVSALGLVPGLSAAGITSGLAALGSIIGGGMAAGITVAAALPIAAMSAGYGVVRGIKRAAREQKLNRREVDAEWEVPREGGAGEITL